MDGNSVHRVASIALKFDAEVTIEDVFDILKSSGVVSKDLVAVQALPGRQYDITFQNVDIKRRKLGALSQHQGCELNDYVEEYKIVTVLHVPQELDDSIVRFVLGRYGKILGGRHLTHKHKDFPGVFNGKRQYKIVLKKDIPSSVKLGGRHCWVRYQGQTLTCLKCGETGHLAAVCDKKRCFNCQEIGHVEKMCKKPIICNTCNKEGHAYKDCPISFANKLMSPSTSWVAGGAVVVNESTEEGQAPKEAEEGEEPKGKSGGGLRVKSTNKIQEASKCDGEGEREEANMSAMEFSEKSEEGERKEVETEIRDAEAENGVEEGDLVIDEEDTLEDGQVIESNDDESVMEGVIPNTAGSDEIISPTQSVERRGVRRAREVSPTGERVRRARKEGDDRSAQAKKILEKSKIFTGEGDWVSCQEEGCGENFQDIELLRIHQVRVHQYKSFDRVACPITTCSSRCNTYQEWANHLANRHPDFVLQHDTEYFDLYFMDESS